VSKSKKSIPITSGRLSKKMKKPEVVKEGTVKFVETEDSGMLAKSRRILEAKAKYYDKLVAGKIRIADDENSLVMFNRKSPTERPPLSSSDESEDDDPDKL